jgi:protein TonB
LRDNIHYPNISRDNNSQGRAFVQFTVNADGSIQDVEIIRSSGDIFLDREAIRVVEAMPKWKPGMQKGKAVRVKFRLPINFRLQ